MRKFFLISVFMSAIVFSSVTHAQNAYLRTMPDVPLMPGMVSETPSETSSFTFDKAEGRIVDETVKAGQLTQQDVAKFYEKTLPPLGWKLVETKEVSQRFVRNGEQLIVKWEQSKDDQNRIWFGLSPERK